MKVDLVGPVKGVRGTHKDSCLVYTEVNGRTVARGRPSGPRKKLTGEQKVWMKNQTAAKRAWRTTSLEQMTGWNRFGRVLAPYTDGRTGGRRGMNVFTLTNTYRTIMGLPVIKDAPTEPAPPPVIDIKLLPMDDPFYFSFIVDHGIHSYEDHALFVRITPATDHVGYAPRLNSLRGICGLGPDSFIPLPASGDFVTFPPATVAIESGQRFMVQCRIIRVRDGLVSEPAEFDLIR